MNNIEGVIKLKEMIRSNLLPLIGTKCALYDTPFYKNIGDVLIWQGELSFLEENHIEVLDYADYHTYENKHLSSDVTILFQGGGNIGDLYHEHVELLLRLVKEYPNNKIIVFSQTVYYKNTDSFNSDFRLISSHKDLYFCCRDYKTFDLVSSKIGTRAIALPDMAFCINTDFLSQWNLKQTKNSLYIRRNDVESIIHPITGTFDKISDWPCFEHKIMFSNVINTLFDRIYRYIIPIRPLIKGFWKKYAFQKFRILMIKDGVRFISPYLNITSERLHGCILAVLLGKNVTVVNNSYGKNQTFYEAWLRDFENISLYEK